MSLTSLDAEIEDLEWPTCVRADLLPGLVVPGLPVSADWTMVLDGDQEETIRIHGVVLKRIEENEADPRVLWWADDPRVGLDNRAMMFLEVDVAHPMVRDRLVRWVAEGIPGRMPPMGLVCSMDPTSEELHMLGALLRAIGAVLKDDPKAQIHLKDVHRMIAGLGGPISDPTPGDAAMEVLEALTERISALEADVAAELFTDPYADHPDPPGGFDPSEPEGWDDSTGKE